MHTLCLGTNPIGWRAFITRKDEAAFQEIAQAVWKRDQWQCQYCGVVMQSGQEIVNVDGCYTNNQLPNLATACPFCAQCGFLESVGFEKYGGGTLIYLPEISQAYLNGLCYPLFKAIYNKNRFEGLAQRTYHTLSLRSQLVEKHLGSNTSDPAVLGRIITESVKTIQSDTFLAQLRLLPMRAAFKERLEGIADELMDYSL